MLGCGGTGRSIHGDVRPIGTVDIRKQAGPVGGPRGYRPGGIVVAGQVDDFHRLVAGGDCQSRHEGSDRSALKRTSIEISRAGDRVYGLIDTRIHRGVDEVIAGGAAGYGNDKVLRRPVHNRGRIPQIKQVGVLTGGRRRVANLQRQRLAAVCGGRGLCSGCAAGRSDCHNQKALSAASNREGIGPGVRASRVQVGPALLQADGRADRHGGQRQERQQDKHQGDNYSDGNRSGFHIQLPFTADKPAAGRLPPLRIHEPSPWTARQSNS